MAFENFPYADFHALNLDWLLKITKYCEEKIKEHNGDIAKAKADILEIFNTLEDLPKALNIEEFVERTLYDMLRSGDLADIAVRDYTHNTFPNWRVSLHPNHEDFAASLRLNQTYTPNRTLGSGSLSDLVRIPFPMPVSVDGLGVSGICTGTKGAWINGLLVSAHGGMQYRIATPEAMSDNETLNVYFNIKGRRASIPERPGAPYNAEMGQQIIEVAQTYVDAQEGGRVFAYGPNFFYNNRDTINNAAGAGMMECDTFAGLVLRGIKYAQSPYADTTPNYEFSYANLPNNPNGYTWVDNMATVLKNNAYFRSDLKFTDQEAFGFWMKGGDDKTTIFSDLDYAMPGDFVIYRNYNATWWDNVAHIGILDFEVDSEGVRVPYMYEVTASSLSEGKVLWRGPLSKRPDYAYLCRVSF